MGNISTTKKETKPHYLILDGLRGVAAFIVIIYHVFEAYATSPTDQWCNHGYLAVPFFFILSGFVIGYAYDDRWTQMGVKEFFKRRLIRLHPMVVVGAILGAVAFFMQGSVQWDGTKIATSSVMLAVLFTLFLIPSAPGCTSEIRGNGELFPLNGPYWSLFLEYLGNILYALLIRRLPTKMLALLVGVTGLGLAWFAISNGSGYSHIGVGWTMANGYLGAGFLVMMFCFSMGLLITRIIKPVHIKGSFWICSLMLIILLAMPYIGEGSTWMNGLYDAICVIIIFPAVVWLGASGTITGHISSRICKFCGDISYPLYMVHYPSMYLFYAWVWDNGLNFEQTWYVGLALIVGNVLLAYVLLKFYDMPVRKWLTSKTKSKK